MVATACLTLWLHWTEYDHNDQAVEQDRHFRTDDGPILTYDWMVPADAWASVLAAEEAIRTGAAHLKLLRVDHPHLYDTVLSQHRNAIEGMRRKLNCDLSKLWDGVKVTVIVPYEWMEVRA